MGYGLNTRILIAVSFVFAFLFLGCIQSGYSQKCAAVAGPVEKDNCVEYMAVWYQDPYTCYEISDDTIKESCLERAVEPIEAKILQAQRSYEQQSIEVIVEEKKVEQNLIEQQDREISPEVESCMQTEGFSLDGCIHKVAIEKKDISMCETIGSENYRRPCISNIAISSKDDSICNQLVRADDKELCKFYAAP